MSDSLRPHGQQHARPPCPSLTLGAYSNSCPSTQWCHPSISSVVLFSSFLQSFPASGSFPMSQFFTSGLPKYWSFRFNISSSNEDSGLISFRMDWFDLLARQGTLTGLVHWDDPEGWYGEEVGGGFRMWNTCTPMADSCGCMAKPIKYCKVISLQLK